MLLESNSNLNASHKMNHAVSFGQSYDNDVTVTYIAPLYYAEVFESLADLHFWKRFSCVYQEII